MSNRKASEAKECKTLTHNCESCPVQSRCPRVCGAQGALKNGGVLKTVLSDKAWGNDDCG